MPTIAELRDSINIAELLDDDKLSKISKQVIQGYELDEDSRVEWKETVDKAMEIAKQTTETKDYPWENASNVKFPLITQASIDFASRVMPELIKNEEIVKINVIGQDPDGSKRDRGRRISQFMSYQLLKESDIWEENMDKMLHMLPILGTAFKKVYYHPITRKPISEVCTPDKIVVNYNITDLASARRITHVLTFYTNDIIERIRMGIYRDVDVSSLMCSEGYEAEQDEDAPLELLEQHCYLDLDDDGYQEPYVVIVHKGTGEVLRIMQRFKSLELNVDDEVKRIEPELYFTDYHFLKSPDGGFYSLGFGTLLYPLNAAINTLLNQLIDSGTLNNNQSGFIGKGLRLKGGEFRFQLGEWRVLNAASGTDIAKNIVPLPTKEPSPTLFQLLGLLIEMGKDLASINDAMQGKQPGQNVPAVTILTLVEQGTKVFSAISKRLYRSLRKEFIRIFDLNKRFLSNEDYMNVLDDPNASADTDFETDSVDISPVADPAMATAAHRFAKAQAIAQLPNVDPLESARYYLEALQVDPQQIEKLVPRPDPNAPPAPELQKLMAEVAKLSAETELLHNQLNLQINTNQLEVEKIRLQEADTMARVSEAKAREQKMTQDADNNARKTELATAKSTNKAFMDAMAFEHEQAVDAAEIDIKRQQLDGKDN